ncbi:kelch-like ECH-associated protein 1 [Paramacrobiotus metropolitanus]|uniref:kelch-like ECH-associated protein 1 n=1 Tax=Paramacrobiotus metropolitanus TaxID=2943436 RepID=UPI002446016C|nr:kelch-like ECH-associated protein 1 [Paramacrobiotus metropolitanus]
MAFLGCPTNNSPALNLLYAIPAEQFALEDPYANHLRYSCDFNVEAGPKYPQIPSSTWTVTITIGVNDASIVAKVEPKGPSEETTSSGSLLVECRVRRNWVGSCDTVVQIDGDGWTTTAAEPEDLSGLVTMTSLPCGKKQCALKQTAFVNVDLTFHIDTESLNAAVNRADLKHLLDSQLLSDCTLICEGHQFSVHRAVLASQSPVFAAMFQNDMTEKSTGICNINDMSAEDLKAMIRYVYTRADLEKHSSLMKLWMAADKYDMADLRAECLCVMLEAVSEAPVDQALSYLNFAHEHNLKKLRTAAARVVSMDVDDS